MTKTRVLLIDDSLTVRSHLREVLDADPEIEVVGEAGDGKRGLELCFSLRPDVISLDIMLPIMNGLEVTERIMADCPTPILIVSASLNRGEVFKTYEALSAGAVDVLEKPSGAETDAGWEEAFCARVKLVARIRVITHPRARLGALGRPSTSTASLKAPLAPTIARATSVIALGASTGGPGALVEVLRNIPSGFPAPIVMVMHIDEPFGASLAEWFASLVPHPVGYARDGEAVADAIGRVVMAPPSRHLVVTSARRFALTHDAPRHSCRPSVDALFESLAREYRSAISAALLTGMGRDGAVGLLAIRKAGGFTIAQDEATSTVYGMPREAVELGAAERVLPLTSIGPTLAASVKKEATR